MRAATAAAHGPSAPSRRRCASLRAVAFAGVTSSWLAACELEEITVVGVEDVVLAEVYVNIDSDPGDNEIRAFLHRTVRSGEVDNADLIAARVTVTREDGLVIRLSSEAAERCVESSPTELPGACFLGDESLTPFLRPGDLLRLSVQLVDGGELTGATRIPGGFELDGFPPLCRLTPNTLLPLAWTRSRDAWAYVNETSIRGLPAALRTEGITMSDDPLYLLGLSVSDADTTIVFPSEFGVFNRFELDQDVAVRLQRGLPEGVRAEVTVTAVDRNYVNWARGGSFNPSGQVRVPSLSGTGTGVFGSTVGRRFNVFSTSDSASPLPACPTG